MAYLLLAVISSALVSIFMRLSTDHIKGKVSMIAVNYLMCLGIALGLTGPAALVPQTEGLGITLALSAVNGVLYLGSFMLLQINAQKNGVVLSAIFMKLGLLVPITLSVLFFGEVPQMLQIAGFVLAVLAIVMINMGSGAQNVQFKTGLVLLLLGGGMADGMLKVFEQFGPAELSSQFLLYTFAVAFVLCTILMFARKERPGIKELLFGLLIGVPNYFSADFLLRSLASVPAVIAYPSFSVATILVVTLAGVLFFKEKLTKRQWIAVGVILVALVLLNI